MVQEMTPLIAATSEELYPSPMTAPGIGPRYGRGRWRRRGRPDDDETVPSRRKLRPASDSVGTPLPGPEVQVAADQHEPTSSRCSRDIVASPSMMRMPYRGRTRGPCTGTGGHGRLRCHRRSVAFEKNDFWLGLAAERDPAQVEPPSLVVAVVESSTVRSPATILVRKARRSAKLWPIISSIA